MTGGKLATYLSFVRFSHSVFALPFALTGALLAWRERPFSWSQVAWIVVCMVSARSAAMGFNRLVDARMDALNPRTAMRELPRGLLSKPEATLFVIGASVVFLLAASQLSRLCLVLAPVGGWGGWRPPPDLTGPTQTLLPYGQMTTQKKLTPPRTPQPPSGAPSGAAAGGALAVAASRRGRGM